MSKGGVQIGYCDSRFWSEGPLNEQVEKTFRMYLVASPFVGFKIASARRRVARLKSKYGSRTQVIIVGRIRGQYERAGSDFVVGFDVFRGANALTCRDPSQIFKKKAVEPAFFPDFTELAQGIENLLRQLPDLYDPSVKPNRVDF